MFSRVLGAWLWTRAVRAGDRLVIAIDGKTVRGAKSKGGKAPHLVAALAHGIGAVLGQVAVDEKSNEIPAVRDLLKAFASLASAVITIDQLCGRPHKASYAGIFVMPTCVGTCRRSAWRPVTRSA
jgi:hypothetical protein